MDESYDKFDLPNSELMIFHKKNPHQMNSALAFHYQQLALTPSFTELGLFLNLLKLYKGFRKEGIISITTMLHTHWTFLLPRTALG